MDSASFLWSPGTSDFGGGAVSHHDDTGKAEAVVREVLETLQTEHAPDRSGPMIDELVASVDSQYDWVGPRQIGDAIWRLIGERVILVLPDHRLKLNTEGNPAVAAGSHR